jgi:uncharacterized phiE125 gp8 family phage protein
MSLAQTTAPTDEPVTLADMKEHLRVELHDDNDLITDLMRAAREHVEDFTNRQLMLATWTYTLRTFPGSRIIELPKAPLSSVTSIKYDDDDGTEQTFSSDYYSVYTNTEPGYVELDQDYNWESTYGDSQDVTITFVAGYATAAAVPFQLKHAIKLLVAHWYEHREAVIDGMPPQTLPIGLDRLLWPHRFVVTM